MQIIPIAISAASVGFFVYCLHRSILAKRSSSWPKTKARVVASHVEVSNNDNRRSESLVFAYEYQVEGDNYVSTDLYPGWESSWSTTIPGLSSARHLASSHPLDSTVEVYYSPDNPTMSCIYPGRQGGPRLGMVISVIGLVIAMVYAQQV